MREVNFQNVDLNLLRVFDAVYRERHLTRAGQYLCLTQPAMSHALARLRTLFGVPHFTLHPFVAERLFSTWLALHPEIRLRQIWRGRFVDAAAVSHEPEMRSA